MVNVDFTPISAADTFVYRMLHADPNVKMDMKLLQKFGVNEVGRRTWNKMNEEDRREMITDYFSKGNINDTLQLTGYNHFTSIINEYLTKERQSEILINRIKQELNKEELINKNISTDKDEIKKLISIYNSYCSKVWVIDKLYKTNNSHIVTNLINQHISRWINQISDISNKSEESIMRLQEYKEIITELNTNIDPYVLVNTVKMDIEESKKKRWSDSLGINTDNVIQIGLTIRNTLNNLFGGYSSLQNEYYLHKLEEDNTYHNFPNEVFVNIDALRENSYDAVEPTIDNVIHKIKNIISTQSWIHSSDTPVCGYYETGKENTITKFCNTLMDSYNYPKEKIIEFIKEYILNRYNVLSYKLPGETFDNHPNALYTDYVKSYAILFDSWLSYRTLRPSIPLDYYKYLKNISFINKSYLHTSSSLDFKLDYYCKESEILAIPIYLYSLVVNVKVDSDSEGYSSADEKIYQRHAARHRRIVGNHSRGYRKG
jgi:hypothetical protein